MRALPHSAVLTTLRRGRRLALATTGLLVALAGSPPARAQVNDAERAAARELFKEGDELQRGGKFTEALDKFQRAERVYSAPTNVLHIAECQAALGQLVESAESYRVAIRTPLAAGSPQAFQTAIDQAKGELVQLEPRVPKLVVQVAPATATSVQMQIDGQTVSAALVGVSIPLDPGVHKVRVSAPGFASSEQDARLKERETTSVLATLAPTAGVASPPPFPPPASPPPFPPPSPPPFPPPAAPSAAPSAAAPPPNPAPGTAPGAPPPYMPPPAPPPQTDKDAALRPKASLSGMLLGAHLGGALAGGKLPLEAGSTVDANVVGAGGAAYGLDAGLRFARQWYVGLALEHAELGHGDLSALSGVSDASSSTTLLELLIAFIGNPDRASFYGELGAGNRWFSFTETGSTSVNGSYKAGELTLGAGLWLPAGSSLRLLPKVTVGVGSFDPPTGSGSPEGHSFAMLGLAGFYNIDF
jgi:hypothetical protein